MLCQLRQDAAWSLQMIAMDARQRVQEHDVTCVISETDSSSHQFTGVDVVQQEVIVDTSCQQQQQQPVTVSVLHQYSFLVSSLSLVHYYWPV